MTANFAGRKDAVQVIDVGEVVDRGQGYDTRPTITEPQEHHREDLPPKAGEPYPGYTLFSVDDPVNRQDLNPSRRR